MTAQSPVYTIDEFERESRHLEAMIWEAIALQPGSKVLFCGYGPDGRQVERAIREGAKVTVIEHRNEEIHRFAHLRATLVRGSTSVIPARDGTFDLAISFHYLHEVDPFFHAQVVFELSRVAKRIAIVEPAPPVDPLGKRIALLYSQVKRELGQFEYYQPLEYWKKLIHSVKADVSQHVFAFAKVPPREYLQDSIKLLIDTIEVEEAPRSYIDELRQIAQRSDVQILPPPRFVVVGAAAGELVAPTFSAREPAPISTRPSPVVAAVTPTPPTAAPIAFEPSDDTPRAITQEAGYAFPTIEPPTPKQSVAAPAPAAKPEPAFGAAARPDPPFGAAARPEADEAPTPGFTPTLGLPFGIPPPPQADVKMPPGNAPFGVPFAMPSGQSDTTPFGVPPDGTSPVAGWEWEPPENLPGT